MRPFESYDEVNRRMAGTLGARIMGDGVAYGTPKRNIDEPFDDFSVRPSNAGGAAGVNKFSLYNASAGATLKVGIRPGLVNQISPTFTGASPSGELEDVPPPLLTITATTYFWLKCVGTFGSPDSYVVTVESNTTGTVPTADSISGTGFTSLLYLGSATVSGGAITSISSSLNADLNVESYGSVNAWTAQS